MNPPESTLVSSKSNSAERVLEGILAPYGANSPQDLPRLSETQIRQIAQALERVGKESWSRVPRLFAVLHMVKSVHIIETFISIGVSDLWFPFSVKTLPDSLRSASTRARFLEVQDYVLTKALDLERESGSHRHFSKAHDIPLEKLEELGKGGFGFVDRVVSTITHKEYARKLIPRGRTFKKDAQVLRDFERELGHLKKLSHLHIVELIGSYTDPKFVGILMAPVADYNLKEFLARDPLPPGDRSFLRTFYGCLVSALCYLHDNQVRHKDIKPQNVLVKGHHVYLTDFGISLDWSDVGQSTTTGATIKTPRYCAPEVADYRPRNSLSDVWSLGCVFVEIWTVLKGATVVDLFDFLAAEGSKSQCYYLNREMVLTWCYSLEANRATADENPPLAWILGALNPDQNERWTARKLVDTIAEANENPDHRFAFSGVCCIDEENSSNSNISSKRSSRLLDETGVSSIVAYIPPSSNSPRSENPADSAISLSSSVTIRPSAVIASDRTSTSAIQEDTNTDSGEITLNTKPISTINEPLNLPKVYEISEVHANDDPSLVRKSGHINTTEISIYKADISPFDTESMENVEESQPEVSPIDTELANDMDGSKSDVSLEYTEHVENAEESQLAATFIDTDPTKVVEDSEPTTLHIHFPDKVVGDESASALHALPNSDTGLTGQEQISASSTLESKIQNQRSMQRSRRPPPLKNFNSPLDTDMTTSNRSAQEVTTLATEETSDLQILKADQFSSSSSTDVVQSNLVTNLDNATQQAGSQPQNLPPTLSEKSTMVQPPLDNNLVGLGIQHEQQEQDLPLTSSEQDRPPMIMGDSQAEELKSTDAAHDSPSETNSTVYDPSYLRPWSPWEAQNMVAFAAHKRGMSVDEYQDTYEKSKSKFEYAKHQKSSSTGTFTPLKPEDLDEALSTTQRKEINLANDNKNLQRHKTQDDTEEISADRQAQRQAAHRALSQPATPTEAVHPKTSTSPSLSISERRRGVYGTLPSPVHWSTQEQEKSPTNLGKPPTSPRSSGNELLRRPSTRIVPRVDDQADTAPKSPSRPNKGGFLSKLGLKVRAKLSGEAVRPGSSISEPIAKPSNDHEIHRKYFTPKTIQDPTLQERPTSYITASANRKFHLDHFKCAECGMIFGAKDSYFEHQDTFLCQYHYFTNHAVKCTGCRISIMPKSIELNKDGNKEPWHSECYRISKHWGFTVASIFTNLYPEGQPFLPMQNPTVFDRTKLQAFYEAFEQQTGRIVAMSQVFQETASSIVNKLYDHLSTKNHLGIIDTYPRLIALFKCVVDALDKIESNPAHDQLVDFDLKQSFLAVNCSGPWSTLKQWNLDFQDVCNKLWSQPDYTKISQEVLNQRHTPIHYLRVMMRRGMCTAMKLGRTQDPFEGLRTFSDAIDDQMNAVLKPDWQFWNQRDSLTDKKFDYCRSCNQAIRGACFCKDGVYGWHVDCFPCQKCNPSQLTPMLQNFWVLKTPISTDIVCGAARHTLPEETNLVRAHEQDLVIMVIWFTRFERNIHFSQLMSPEVLKPVLGVD